MCLVLPSTQWWSPRVLQQQIERWRPTTWNLNLLPDEQATQALPLPSCILWGKWVSSGSRDLCWSFSGPWTNKRERLTDGIINVLRVCLHCSPQRGQNYVHTVNKPSEGKKCWNKTTCTWTKWCRTKQDSACSCQVISLCCECSHRPRLPDEHFTRESLVVFESSSGTTQLHTLLWSERAEKHFSQCRQSLRYWAPESRKTAVRTGCGEWGNLSERNLSFPERFCELATQKRKGPQDFVVRNTMVLLSVGFNTVAGDKTVQKQPGAARSDSPRRSPLRLSTFKQTRQKSKAALKNLANWNVIGTLISALQIIVISTSYCGLLIHDPQSCD